MQSYKHNSQGRLERIKTRKIKDNINNTSSNISKTLERKTKN